MLSHVFVGVSDFERAFAFYDAVMRVLGVEARFCDRTRPWAGWHAAGGERPYFVIAKPFDERPHDAGNGQMIGFVADRRATVVRAYETALASGGTAEGAPGLRPEYHADYFGAYFRDPDGNKLCVACHGPE